jgi:hypothetical protein
MSDQETNCFQIIKNLFEKYKDNEYLLQRINIHFHNLPNTLEHEHKNYEKKINRNNYLSNEQQIFIQVFLSKYQYYYLHNNNSFYEYNGKNYKIIKEDDIIHNLLSTISKERVLLEWKHKTKNNIIKLIKERNLFTCIPETDTIQNVLNFFYPSIFSTKSQAKYFLTIIGDNILKKNSHLIFLVTQNMKKLLSEIDTIASITIGNINTTSNFMTKYHENHSYDNCRLIKMSENISIDVWKDILQKKGLDILCIASHYSNRYENSDNYIDNKADEELKNYSYYLKNNKQQEIVEKFCSKYIKIDDVNECKIEWKNLHFIWKQFLFNYNLPNMIYSNTLKNILKEKYIYNEENDSFINITSKYLPVQSDFIKFWENNIKIIQDQNTDVITESELEVDELCSLFKLWSKQTEEQLLTNGNISEENVIKILKHFFPHIEIIEYKYVLNVSCILWNKNNDINFSFAYIKEQIKNDYTLALISFEDAYNYYYKYCNLNSYKFIVSKRYFENYLYFKFENHIVYEKFIETQWFLDQCLF